MKQIGPVFLHSGGWSLSNHRSGSIDLATTGNWDVVVLQDQSQRPSFPRNWVNSLVIHGSCSRARHYRCMATFCLTLLPWSLPSGKKTLIVCSYHLTSYNLARNSNPCTVPVFFLTWGKRDGDSQNCANDNYFCSFEGIQVVGPTSQDTYICI